MILVDHIFMLLLFVVQPIHGAYAYRRYLRKIAAGEPADRIRLFRETLLLEWVAFAVLAVTWVYFGRSFADFGFVWPGGRNFWIGAMLLIPVCGFLVYSWRKCRTLGADDKARQRQSFGNLVHFLPHTNSEYRTFFGLSITAGIVEETIYRGFAFWYLSHFMPLWGVIAVSSLGFGLGHSYQGAGGIVRVTLIGAVFGAIYVYTGSIWLPIIGHALLDILQGAAVLEILRDQGTGADKSPSSPGSSNSTRPRLRTNE